LAGLSFCSGCPVNIPIIVPGRILRSTSVTGRPGAIIIPLRDQEGRQVGHDFPDRPPLCRAPHRPDFFELSQTCGRRFVEGSALSARSGPPVAPAVSSLLLRPRPHPRGLLFWPATDLPGSLFPTGRYLCRAPGRTHHGVGCVVRFPAFPILPRSYSGGVHGSTFQREIDRRGRA
jgi:hypothetical protein